MFRSIRWQLPLSYAAIALLAALALGAVLVSILLGYYAQRELDYLRGNAKAIGQFVMESGAWDLSGPELQAQVQSLAFLEQTRVRLLDKDGRVLADTGHADGARYVSLSSLPLPGAAPDASIHAFPGGKPLIVIRAVSGNTSEALPAGLADALMLKSSQVLTGTAAARSMVLYNFAPVDEATMGGVRSIRVVRQALIDGAGNFVGYVELSEGPAYGSLIVASVARGWAIASAVAVLLATAAGWLTSRRISSPIAALAGATERMAGGDLAARAATGRRAPRELASLAHSFNQMADQVEETVGTLRRFVSDAAHELHTPLTALRTNLELASGETEMADVLPLLERAQTQVQRLGELTDSLLELSRLEAGAAGEDKSQVRLGGVIREMAELEASRAEQAGLNFLLDLPEAELVVDGRQDRLSSLVANLVDNAIKFTPAGGTVTLGLKRDEAWAVLWVADTGIGIPAKDLPQLFNRFHRGRNTTGYPGNGLGLAIVKAIAQGHGGSVTAQNATPGARFVVRLPLSAAK